MPALFAYILAVAIFLGGGYGALNWLAAPEPVKVATKTKHAPRPEVYGATAAKPAEPTDIATPVAVPLAAASDRSGKADASSPPPAGASAAAATPDKRYDAMARIDTTVAETPAAPAAPAIKPAIAPTSTKPEAQSEAAKPVIAKTASAERESRRIEAQPKRSRIRQAEERGHRRYEVMTLRTIEFDDGHRETRLLPLRRRDDAVALQWGD